MNSKETIKKYNKILITFFITVGIIIMIMIGILLFLNNDNLKTNLNIILLIILLVITALFKNVIQGYKNMAQIARVVLKQSPPLKYNTNIYTNKKYLIDNQYNLFQDSENYSIYYKYNIDINFKFFKNKKLKTIVLIKKQKISYYNKNLHDDIGKLEDNIIKSNKFHKHMILAFNEFDNINKDNIGEIGEVVSYGVGKQFFTQINIGLNKYDSKAYFLYSDKYTPNMDYKELIDDIKQIIN